MTKNNKCVAMLVAFAVGFLAAQANAGVLDGLNNYWDFDNNLNDTGPAGSVADNGVFDGANGTAGIGYGPGYLGTGGLEQNGAGGANENDGFVRVARSADTLYGTTSTVSTSLWVRASDFDTNWQTILAHGEGANYRIARRGSDNVASYAGGSGDIPGSAIGPDLSDNLWHHVVAISDGGVDTQIWVDNMLVETGGAAAIDDQGNSNPIDADLFIGANPQTGGQNREWWGEIDDVGQWGRALNSGEISMIYEAGRAGTPLIGVPEPSALGLLVFGLLGFAGLRRKR